MSISRKQEVGELFQSLINLTTAIRESDGTPDEIFQRLQFDPSFTRLVADVTLETYRTTPISYRFARKICGQNFLGFEAWKRHQLIITGEMSKKIEKFPWHADVLFAPCPFYKGKQVWQTHCAFLGLVDLNGKTLTLARLEELYRSEGSLFGEESAGDWRSNGPHPYADEAFYLEQTLESRWYLMLKEIIPGSENKALEDQMGMLPSEYVVPRAVEEATKLVLLREKTKICANRERFARCMDSTSTRGGVGVGLTSEDYVAINTVPENFANRAYMNVGLAASRKLPGPRLA